jgi:hypothetical protein
LEVRVRAETKMSGAAKDSGVSLVDPDVAVTE